MHFIQTKMCCLSNRENRLHREMLIEYFYDSLLRLIILRLIIIGIVIVTLSFSTSLENFWNSLTL